MSVMSIRILVLLVVLLPLVWALVLPLFGLASRRLALWFALSHVVLTLALAFLAAPVLEDRSQKRVTGVDASFQQFEPLYVPGDAGTAGVVDGATARTKWTLLELTPTAAEKAGPRVQFFIGIDGLNIWLMMLASLMMVPAILVSWDAITDRPGAFYAWLFVLQAGAIGAFLSFDIILFYAFFELTLIPTFFLIGGWGTGSGRRDAARKFFLYTLGGSLFTLVGLIGIVLTNPLENGQITFSLPDLMLNVQRGLAADFAEHLSGKPGPLAARQVIQFWLFVALIAGFLVKVPVWPFHTWLPATYGEAPIGVTVLLTALLAKLGTFGFIRFVLPLTPDAALAYGLPAIGTLAAIGIVYGALCAYGQRDIKLMIAYSSISHLGFLVLAIFAFNAEGMSGASLHMVNHGVSTGALFALLAFLIDRYRTTDMAQYGGLMGRFPRFAFLTFVLCLASIGLPGLNNFVSEMLMIAGLTDMRNPSGDRPGLMVVSVISIFLSAWYILTMLKRVFFNPLREPAAIGVDPPNDVNQRELFAFGGLATLCLFLGLFPQLLIEPMKADVEKLNAMGEMARYRMKGTSPYDELPAPKGPSQDPNAKTKGGGKGGGGEKGGGKGGGGGGKGGGKGKAGGDGGNKGKSKTEL